MTDKLDAISQSKEAEEVLKQEKFREQAQAAKQAEKPVDVASKEKADAKPAAKDAKAAEKPQAAKKADKKKFVLERVYTIPLSKAYEKSRSHRGRIAVSLLRQFVAKHAKAASPASVSIDQKINSAVLTRGSRRPPKSLRVLVQKDDEGKVMATLAA